MPRPARRTANAFNRKWCSFADIHRATAKLFGVGRAFSRILVHIGGNDVVSDDMPSAIEPKHRKIRENFTFAGDGRVHDHIEGRNSIGGDHQECVAEIIHITNFTPAKKR